MEDKFRSQVSQVRNTTPKQAKFTLTKPGNEGKASMTKIGEKVKSGYRNVNNYVLDPKESTKSRVFKKAAKVKRETPLPKAA